MGCQLNDLIDGYKELSPKEAKELLKRIKDLQDDIDEHAEATYRLAYAIESQTKNER